MSDQQSQGQGSGQPGNGERQQPEGSRQNETRRLNSIRGHINFFLEFNPPTSEEGVQQQQQPQQPQQRQQQGAQNRQQPSPRVNVPQQQQQQPQSPGNPPARTVRVRRSFELQVERELAERNQQRAIARSIPQPNPPPHQTSSNPTQQPTTMQPPSTIVQSRSPQTRQVALRGFQRIEPRLALPTVSSTLNDEFLQQIAMSQGVEMERGHPYYEIIRTTFSQFVVDALQRAGEAIQVEKRLEAANLNTTCAVEENAKKIMKRKRDSDDDEDRDNDNGPSRTSNPVSIIG